MKGQSTHFLGYHAILTDEPQLRVQAQDKGQSPLAGQPEAVTAENLAAASADAQMENAETATESPATKVNTPHGKASDRDTHPQPITPSAVLLCGAALRCCFAVLL